VWSLRSTLRHVRGHGPAADCPSLDRFLFFLVSKLDGHDWMPLAPSQLGLELPEEPGQMATEESVAGVWREVRGWKRRNPRDGRRRALFTVPVRW